MAKTMKMMPIVPVHCFNSLPVTLTGLKNQVTKASTIKKAVAMFNGVILNFIFIVCGVLYRGLF